MSTRNAPRFTSLVIAALALAASPAVAAPIVFSATGTTATAMGLTQTIADFRTASGNPNNANAPGPLPSGRREINWDGGGAATTFSATPFAGFQDIRGALFTTPGTGFLQAPPAGLDDFFGRTDNLYDLIFDPFSPQRVFTPVGSTITDTTFFVPGSGGATPATVNAFGVIFSDVDLANVSSLQFFDPFGASLGTFFVPAIAGNNTFSFLGVRFDAGELIGRVRITSGNVALGPTNTAIDQVVMDDFIFSEPQQIPEPSSLALLIVGAAGLRAWRVRNARKKSPQ